MQNSKFIVFFIFYFLFSTQTQIKAQWQFIQNSDSWNITCMEASGSKIAVGALQGILTSNDFGSNWYNSGDLSYQPIYSLAINNNSFYAGSNPTFYRSTDNGNTFSFLTYGIVLSGPTTAINANGSTIYFGNYNTGLYVSTNNGTSWTLINNGLTSFKLTFIKIKGSKIFVGTEDAGIFVSNDNGLNWTSSNNGINTSTYVASYAVIDTNILVNNGGTIKISHNNGLNWSSLNGLAGVTVTDIKIYGNNIIAGTNHNGIFITTDYGQYWEQIGLGFPNYSVSCMAISGTSILLGTFTNGIWHRLLTEIVGINDSKKAIDFNTSASPNPFTNTTTIKYTITQNENVQITIHNIIGVQVAEICNQYQTKGDYAINYNAQNLPSGTYFYRLKVGNKITTNKLILTDY